MEYGTSPVVQWLRICLPVQGTWVQSLVQKEPTCRGSNQAYAGSQLLSLHTWSPYSSAREATAMRHLHTLTREYPLLAATREKPACSNKDPAQPKK